MRHYLFVSKRQLLTRDQTVCRGGLYKHTISRHNAHPNNVLEKKDSDKQWFNKGSAFPFDVQNPKNEAGFVI